MCMKSPAPIGSACGVYADCSEVEVFEKVRLASAESGGALSTAPTLIFSLALYLSSGGGNQVFFFHFFFSYRSIPKIYTTNGFPFLCSSCFLSLSLHGAQPCSMEIIKVPLSIEECSEWLAALVWNMPRIECMGSTTRCWFGCRLGPGSGRSSHPISSALSILPIRRHHCIT